ncbi:MAG: Fic family protein [bacterium]|nr:Fic family protein [bacterium]
MQSKDIKDFRSGNWVQRYEYKSFAPTKIHLQWFLSDPVIQYLLSEADRHLGRLDAFSELIPDIDFFIKMHVTKEATLSSKIEGTKTSFEEALLKEEDIGPQKKDDWKEVHSYIEAVNQATLEMERLPISTRLIKNTHKTLMQGVRGKEKLPGEFRRSQNWIGNSLKNAVFVPPTHEEIPDLMKDLEDFINAESLKKAINVPHLIKIAIIHYQFETIHPFLDGNGRIGRLLITLYLKEKGLLQKPTLYLSDFFERNRKDYYDNLTTVRTKNDMEQWIQFFLTGVIETAKKSVATFQHIIKLRNEIELNKLISLGRKQADAKRLINELYRQPILDSSQVINLLNIHASTANRLLADFERLGILKELTGYKRNRIYVFEQYIKLF